MEHERIIEALKICDSNYDGVVCKKCPIRNEYYNGPWYDKDGDCYQHLMQEAAELLSAQPERNTGHWILYDKRFPWSKDYKCSECGNYINISNINAGRGSANFCPNCGADMRGEQRDR